jgi:hypothetical protein
MGVLLLGKTSTMFCQFTLLILFLLSSVIVSPEDSRPEIAASVIELQLPSPALYIAGLSSRGSYVVARTNQYLFSPESSAQYQGSELHVWDLQNVETVDRITSLLPAASVELNDDYSERGGADYVISPDESSVAVQLENELLVLTLPELEVYKSMSTTGWGDLSWSLDGHLLGAVYESEILAWDIENEIVHRHELESISNPLLVALETGWLLDNYSNDNDLAFVFCDSLLEQCQSYEFEDSRLYPVVATLDGHTILTTRGHPAALGGIDVGVWQFQEDAEYDLVKELPQPEPGICPASFSPTGRYLTSDCYDAIWDFELLTMLHTLEGFQHPVWLPDEEYFLSLDARDALSTKLALYQIGQQEPLDELVFSSISELNWLNLINDNIEMVTHSLGGSVMIDQDGQLVLVDLGWIALIVPIIYS